MNTSPRSHPAVDTALFDDDGLHAVLFDERDRGVHILNSEASAVWSLIDGTTAASAIAAELAVLFDAAPDQVRADVQRVLEELWSLGLLQGRPELPAAAD